MRGPFKIAGLLLVLAIAAPTPGSAGVSTTAGVSTVIEAMIKSSDRQAYLSVLDTVRASVATSASTRQAVTGCVYVRLKQNYTTYIPGYGVYSYPYWGTADMGCGTAKVTIDPLGDVTRVTGSFKSEFSAQKIKVDITLRANTPFVPFMSGSSGGEFLTYPGSEDGLSHWGNAMAGVRRETVATGSVSGVIKVTKKSGTGYLFRGVVADAGVWN